MSKLFVVLSIAFFGLAFESLAGELRCDQLGGDCVCSEPLNSQQNIGPSTFVNPTDTSAKECRGEGGNGGSVYAQHGGSSVAAFGFPSGSSVSWVWRLDGGGINHLTGNSQTFTQGTLCTRIYQRFSTDFPTPIVDGPDVRAKLMEISLVSGGSQFLNQSQWHFATNPSGFKNEVVGFGIDQDVSPSGSSVRLDDCKSHWCRMEQCVDRYPDGRIVSRARIKVIGTSQEATFVSSTGSKTGEATTYHIWIGNLFRQNSSTGSRFISHGIQSFSSQTNGAAWIGPASEIETGGAAPEPSVSLQAPILLP